MTKRYQEKEHGDLKYCIEDTLVNEKICNEEIVKLLNSYDRDLSDILDDMNILKSKLRQYERIMSDFDITDYGELRTIVEHGCGI